MASFITSVARFIVSDLATLMSVGSNSLLIIQRPVAVEKTKKTNVSNKTYRNGSGPFFSSCLRNFAKTNPPLQAICMQEKGGLTQKSKKRLGKWRSPSLF